MLATNGNYLTPTFDNVIAYRVNSLEIRYFCPMMVDILDLILFSKVKHFYWNKFHRSLFTILCRVNLFILDRGQFNLKK